MNRDRLLAWMITALIPLLLSLPIVPYVQAHPISQNSASRPGPTPALSLGWTVDGTLILATPGRVFQLEANGTWRPTPASPGSGLHLTTTAATSSSSQRRLARLLGGPGWVLGSPQLSPDGKWLVVERAPTGSETMGYSELWLADRAGNSLRRIAQEGAHAPAWSPDGRKIAYLRGNTVWLYDMANSQAHPLASPPIRRFADSSTTRSGWRAHRLASPPSLTPPATIRVLHRPDNPCRDRPAWAIDEIPFEEYLRHVVPAEVPAWWPKAVLRAQAIAARTYAWYQVLQGHPDFDVTDWTDYQVMCDATYPATDAAVAATQGEYLSYNGLPILAQYGAENGHPTQSGGLPYLSAVPDPVSLGHPRRGHGHGLSQWGAYRWATRYDWDALQILAHYYTGVQIRRANESSPFVLGITAPWNGWFYGGSGAWLTANATPSEEITRVVFWANGRKVAEDEDPSDGWGTALSLSDIGPSVALTVSADTISGTITGENVLRLGIDQVAPRGTATLLPPTEPPPTITLGLDGSDTGSSGFQGIGISADWLWEGEGFSGSPGTPITDANASGGLTWWAQGNGQSGMWTSPPTQELSVGHIYRALFRLRTREPLTTAVIARLEVSADNGARLLGLADVRGLDFRAPDQYQDIPVDFWYDALSPDGLRFRVRFTGAADLALDRVLVVSYPTLQPPQDVWPLPSGARAGRLTAVAFDRAGNASTPGPVALPPAGSSGPGAWQNSGPLQWITDTTRPNVYITVSAPGGFEPAGAACRVSGDRCVTWSDWVPAEANASAGAITSVMLSCRPPYPREGEMLTIQFRAEDVHGRTGSSPPFAVRVDTHPPTITLHLDGRPGENGWFLGPVTATLTATDTASGLREMMWRIGDDAWHAYTSPIVIGRPGTTAVQARAVDQAGLESRKAITILTDMQAPTTTISATTRVLTPPILAHWRGVDDASGIASYDVQVRRDGETEWMNWLTGTTQEEKGYRGVHGGGYSFRARAHDVAGRVGPWSPPV
ncbi:MAG: SpoIID/LytB domain-containing protein, partial [Anaerolineae bacterium]|nr:SpoIID/LytB domain-containing protein [Anaerolineae bacterium]